MKRCENGHLYDETIYSSCPYCNNQKLKRIVVDDEVNADISNKPEGTTRLDVTDFTTTFYGKEIEHGDYVTGWLVCLEGPVKGKDFRITYGYSRIGRGRHMDISIPEDLAITRDNHASIVYDPKKNYHYLVPSQSNFVYINSTYVTKPTRLHIHDFIQLGNSVFEFIPFCVDEHSWE